MEVNGNRLNDKDKWKFYVSCDKSWASNTCENPSVSNMINNAMVYLSTNKFRTAA